MKICRWTVYGEHPDDDVDSGSLSEDEERERADWPR